MGLDMNAFKIKPEFMVDPEQQVDLEFKPAPLELRSNETEIAYWRKFHHLHGWMERLYREKGGKSEQFNCDTVRLMPHDLTKLAEDSLAGLAATSGFFFGNSEWDVGCAKEVAEFCQLAEAAIADGYVVFYTSWW